MTTAYMPIIQYIKANTNDTNQYKTVRLLLAKASQTFNVRTLNIPIHSYNVRK